MAKKKSFRDDAFKHLENFGIGTAKFVSPGNIPTGHFALDFAIHFGCDPTDVDLNNLEGYDPTVPLGLPLGKVVEISGAEGGGKSSLAYRVAGSAQKLGLNVAWLDAEHSFSESLATINGCEVEDIIFPSNNLFAEQFLDVIQSLCVVDKVPMMKNGKKILVDPPKVIVLDSVASLVPKDVGESTSEQKFVGLLPRVLSQNLGKIQGAAEEFGVLIIFINQIREKIGVMFGNPETTPGGRALKHGSSLRIKITMRKSADACLYRTDEETGKEVLIGRHSYVKIEKNRFAKPMLDIIDIPIYYEAYFPGVEDIIFNVGRQLKLISVRKGVYSWSGHKKEGKAQFVQYLVDNKLLDSLVEVIKEKSVADNILLPPELMKYEGQDGMDGQIQRSGEAEDNSSGEEKPKKRGRKKGS